MSEAPGEFTLIARHFRALAGPEGLDLVDDAAVLSPPVGRHLVLTADAMVGTVHFFPDDPPDLIARKLLRTNLSDLAAMGATPLGYLLTISAPGDTSDGWFAGFAAGLAQDQKTFNISLFGGDTTRTPGPLTLSLTAIGHVAPGGAVRRSTARAGDDICVTGTIGDGALGLAVAQGRLADPTGYLLDRYRLPQPRLHVLDAGVVRAAMDISDGLVQDLGHMARASHLAAVVDADRVPLSLAARRVGPGWCETILTGGDDYELLMAIPPGGAGALQRSTDVPITVIGRFEDGQGVTVRSAGGGIVALSREGWSHF